MSLLQEIAENAGTTEAEARAVLRALTDTYWGHPEDIGPTAVAALKDMVRKHVLEERE